MNNRMAFSLFEVMIAMAICVAGLALILQMLGTSETLSRRAELHLKSQQHCRSLLNCYLAGIDEPKETRREELMADPEFWYAVKLEKHPLLPLETIVVDVWPKSPRERQGHSSGMADTSGDEATERQRDDANKFRLVGNRPRVADALSTERDESPQGGASISPPRRSAIGAGGSQ